MLVKAFKNILNFKNNYVFNLWKEIGVKMPKDLICSYIMDALESPLICGSVPEDAEDELGV